MHVGLNLFHLVPRETGGAETYDRCLIAALRRERPDVRLTLYCFAGAEASLVAEPWSSEVSIATLPGSGRNRIARVAAEQALAPLLLRDHVDLLHNLLTTAPALPGVPQVTTVHDVIYKRYPETAFGILSVGVAALVPVAVRRSRRILAPSEATKTDLVDFFGTDPAKIDVTLEGPGLPIPADPLAEGEVRSQLGLSDAPIVLSPSARRPHKNLERLLDAFAGIRTEPAPLLVLPGYATQLDTSLARRAHQRVRFAGWVPDDVLDALYRIARCVVVPSLAEGFGLPVLEAMSRGTPVACSNVSSLPEVAGDAALYFDPQDPDAIRTGIERVLGDESLRERLRAAGLRRSRSFTWERTAASTAESYERALRDAA